MSYQLCQLGLGPMPSCCETSLPRSCVISHALSRRLQYRHQHRLCRRRDAFSSAAADYSGKPLSSRSSDVPCYRKSVIGPPWHADRFAAASARLAVNVVGRGTTPYLRRLAWATGWFVRRRRQWLLRPPSIRLGWSWPCCSQGAPSVLGIGWVSSQRARLRH